MPFSVDKSLIRKGGSELKIPGSSPTRPTRTSSEKRPKRRSLSVGATQSTISTSSWKKDAKAAIAKLSELKIDDESFWQLSEDEFKDKLEITVFGALRLLTLRIAEIKEDHKKTMEKRDKDKKKLSELDKQNVQALLSNTSQSTSDSERRLSESD